MTWYEEEVEQLIQKRDALSYPPQTIFMAVHLSDCGKIYTMILKNSHPLILALAAQRLKPVFIFLNALLRRCKARRRLLFMRAITTLAMASNRTKCFSFSFN